MRHQGPGCPGWLPCGGVWPGAPGELQTRDQAGAQAGGGAALCPGAQRGLWSLENKTCQEDSPCSQKMVLRSWRSLGVKAFLLLLYFIELATGQNKLENKSWLFQKGQNPYIHLILNHILRLENLYKFLLLRYHLFPVLTPWLKYFAWRVVNTQSVSCGAACLGRGILCPLLRLWAVVNISSPEMSDDIVCAACNENIVGKAMKAKDNCFHEHHFVCSHGDCGINLVKLPVYTKYKEF